MTARHDNPHGATFPDPDRAACRHHPDPDLWHEPGREHTAKALCRGCPVVDRCRDWAIATKQTWGVWGATDPEERRELRRRAV